MHDLRARGDPCENGVLGAGLRRSRRQGEQDRKALEAPCEVGEPPKGGGIGPVGIVDGDHHRSVGGEVHAEPVEPVRRDEGCVVGDRLVWSREP
jgi:hypothetical protein